MPNPIVHYRYALDDRPLCGSILAGRQVTGIAQLESVTCDICLAELSAYWLDMLDKGIPANWPGNPQRATSAAGPFLGNPQRA